MPATSLVMVYPCLPSEPPRIGRRPVDQSREASGNCPSCSKQRARARGHSASNPDPFGVLKLEAQHELQLPRQTRPRIRRSHVVIVIVEIHSRCDNAEVGPGGQLARPRVIVECQLVGVAKLSVIEDVERLNAKLHGDALRKLRLLHKSQIHLPSRKSADNAVSL